MQDVSVTYRTSLDAAPTLKSTVLRLGRREKVVREIQALRGVSFEVPEGQVLGVVGANGAGKSTLMRMLATVTRPTEGTVTWRGLEGGEPVDIVRTPNTLRAALGYLPQDFGAYRQLSPLEFLQYIAALKGLRSDEARTRIQELLQMLNLFIPSLALALGAWSGNGRAFQIVHTLGWYLGAINAVAALDYMGLTSEAAAAGVWRYYLMATGVLLGLALLGRWRRVRGQAFKHSPSASHT